MIHTIFHALVHVQINYIFILSYQCSTEMLYYIVHVHCTDCFKSVLFTCLSMDVKAALKVICIIFLYGVHYYL